MKLNRSLLLAGVVVVAVGLGMYLWPRSPGPDPAERKIGAVTGGDREQAASQLDPTRGAGGTILEEPERPAVSQARSEAPSETQASAGKAGKRPRRKARRRPGSRDSQSADEEEDGAQDAQKPKFSGARFVPNP